MTIIASYPNSISAQSAFNKLLESGLTSDHISIATLKSSVPEDMHTYDKTMAVTGTTASGLAAGAAIGFLIGAAALTIPGLGALLVSGELALLFGSGLAAEATIGAAIGSVGGFVTGLVQAGTDEKDAKMLESHLQNGGVILAVKDDATGTHKKFVELTNPVSLIVLAD
jgi:hypothetical protein